MNVDDHNNSKSSNNNTMIDYELVYNSEIPFLWCAHFALIQMVGVYFVFFLLLNIRLVLLNIGHCAVDTKLVVV